MQRLPLGITISANFEIYKFDGNVSIHLLLRLQNGQATLNVIAKLKHESIKTIREYVYLWNMSTKYLI